MVTLYSRGVDLDTVTFEITFWALSDLVIGGFACTVLKKG